MTLRIRPKYCHDMIVFIDYEFEKILTISPKNRLLHYCIYVCKVGSILYYYASSMASVTELVNCLSTSVIQELSLINSVTDATI